VYRKMTAQYDEAAVGFHFSPTKRACYDLTEEHNAKWQRNNDSFRHERNGQNPGLREKRLITNTLAGHQKTSKAPIEWDSKLQLHNFGATETHRLGTLLPAIRSRLGKASPPAPGYHRHACRRKSVPPDHNTETAYFDIPLNAEHGKTVSCCHYICASGRGPPRFRYCLVCQRVVAYQHFWSRHSHEEVFKNATAEPQLGSTFSTAEPMIVDANKNTVSNNAESLSLGSAAPTKLPSDPQVATTTMEVSQEEMQWLKLLRSHHPSLTAISIEDTYPWMRAITGMDTPASSSPLITPTERNSSSESSDATTFSFQQSEFKISADTPALLPPEDYFGDLSTALVDSWDILRYEEANRFIE
jgi:hypothetical protein